MEHELKWYENIVFWSGFIAWFLAQLIKMLTHSIKTRKMDFRFLVSSGGMPSAHSTMACAVASAVALKEGLPSPLFAVALAFAVVVMFDAQTVRRAAGLQARLLNQIMAELYWDRHFSQQKLAELLGHTPLQVYLGMAMGILVSLFVYYFFG